jgi:hypothetical protein
MNDVTMNDNNENEYEMKKNCRVTEPENWLKGGGSATATYYGGSDRLNRKVLSFAWNWDEERACRVEPDWLMLPGIMMRRYSWRSCWGRLFQSTGAWCVNDLSVFFQTRTNGRTLESDSIRGAGICISMALNVKQVIEISRLVRLQSFVGDRDNLILNSLFNFEPMERF